MFEHLVGQTMDRYRIVRQIGEDSLGTVFKAYDPTLQRDVAIKVIYPDLSSQLNFRERFAQAAREAARLDHPGIIQVFDFGESASFHYIVMEYIPGDNLAQMLSTLEKSSRWIFLGEAVHIVRQLALAMEYVRNQGVPQRFIKPADVMVKPIQSDHLPYLPVLTDLGLARLIEGGLGRMVSGENPPIHPAYLSPEGALGRNTDSRSDVYSLGILLFELATGQLPFPIQSLDDAVRYHIRQPLPPPRSIRPDLPEPLEQVIVKALEKNPTGRYGSPAVLANELERLAPAAMAVKTPPPAYENAVSLLVPYRQSLGEERDTPPLQAPAAVPPTQVTPVRTVPDSRTVEVELENSQLSVEPGGQATTNILLHNPGTERVQVRITVEGVPYDWISITPQVVQLMPGESRQVTLNIQPARSPQSRAGRYPFSVHATSQQYPGSSAEAKGTLTVAAFSRFTSQLNSRRIKAGEAGQITVKNQGNTLETYSFNFHDPEGELVFSPPEAPLRLTEGQTGIAEFRASLQQSRWIGGEKIHRFNAQLSATNGETQTHSGEVVSYALIPAWALGLLVFIFVCFASALALLFSGTGLQVSRSTATEVARRTGTAVAIQSTSEAETATALFLSNANSATLQAVTATAAWLALDDDADGLTNQREIELGTLPGDPDTDRDGLSDGDELNRETDPLRPDTDGDGLLDGDEVRQNLNPLSPDTDGDGLPDSQDPNPLQTSTPVPNTAGTAQAAQTQTAAILQGTQAAVNATATAQAAAATAQAAAATATALAQAGQAATATALAQAGQAATATAQAATATALAQAGQTATAQAATLTATAPRRVVYIYLTGNTEAQNFQALLQGNGFQVDLIPLDAIPVTDLASYQTILVGPDTGTGENWGDPQGQQANGVFSAGLPILGLGEGGYALFGRANLVIGWENGAPGEGNSVFVVDPAYPVWTTPQPVPVPGDGILALYNENTPFVAINAQPPPADTILIGRLPDDSARYPIIRQGQDYLLWGFAGGPEDMTGPGQQAFVNALESLLP